MTTPLRAEHTVEFSYRRAVGGATESFLGGLARGELWGTPLPDGRILVPPVDHDPQSGAALTDRVRVPATGTVRSWTWVPDPAPDQPLSTPFAFALIRLDGTSTSLVHVVDVATEDDLRVGLRVRADWAAARSGSITDIRAFVPGEEAVLADPGADPEVLEVVSVLSQHYDYEPGLTLSRFLQTLAHRRIEGGRCPDCGATYVPPRAGCPSCGGSPMVPVELTDTGTVVSFSVVHVAPFGSSREVPFAWAWIRLDGADVPFPHLLGGGATQDVRVGQRVRAVWVPDTELAATWASIEYFERLPS